MKKTKIITISAILIAIGVLIPMTMPKIYLPPMSWTLFSHVPIFIAAFISPVMAAAVAIGTTLGFQMSGVAPIIVSRAATHLIFATALASCWSYLSTKNFWVKNVLANILTAIVHAFCEAMVVMFFFNAVEEPAKYIWITVFLGTVIHSLFDFEVAYLLFCRTKRK